MTKSVLAFVDQLLNAGSSFLISVLLARWLPAEQYGVYALALSVFMFAAGVHQSLLLEPMMVFGPSSYQGCRRGYLGALILIQGIFGIVLFAVLAIAALITHRFAPLSGLDAALAGLSVAAPCLLLLWLSRHGFYLEQSPASAAAGALLYSLLVLSGTLIIYRRGNLSPLAAFLVMAAGAVVTTAFMLARLKPTVRLGTSDPSLSYVWRKHWDYGRWALGTSAVKWIPGNVCYALTGTLLGMADVGGLKALLNIWLPLGHTANSFQLLFQPRLSGIFGKEGPSSTRTPVLGLTLLFLVGGIAYWVLVMLFKIQLFYLLYGGKFVEFLYLVPWVTLGAVLTVASYGPAVGLRAIQCPHSIFTAYSIASLISVVVGIVGTWKFGLAGAVASFVTSGVILLFVIAHLYFRKAKLPDSRVNHNCDVSRTPQENLESVKRPLKVLVSAYACEPGKGSEPGVGWNWVCQIARFHEVWVLTRTKNRHSIDIDGDQDPLLCVHWVYFDLPRWASFWRKERRGRHLYYYLWQLSAFFAARELHRKVGFDLVHHVTFVNYWMPSLLPLLPVPFIWGPVGGGESAPRTFWRSLSLRGKLYEAMRDLGRSMSELNPVLRLTARRSTLGLATTHQTEIRLRTVGCRNVSVLSQVGLPEHEILRLASLPFRQSNPFRVVSVGSLLHLKGLSLGLRAFARFQLQFPATEYWLIGDGPERKRLERLARELYIDKKVVFMGTIARREVLEKLAECDVLLHPALHESGGWVSLEAMAAGRPVICLDLGGLALQVTSETGIKVPARSPEQATADLAQALYEMARDPLYRKSLGEAARERVKQDFNWEKKGEHLNALYEKLTRSNLHAQAVSCLKEDY